MATPVQYIQQPILTDVGLFQQQLAQDQARHDQAMANQLAMEDQFAQIPTLPGDIPVKNRVLGEYQQKVKDVVDRYGGDYGAAAKDITRLTSKTRQSPFFQLAPERRRLAEEERKMRAQLGPNAIVKQSIMDAPIQDPESGEWISPDALGYEVLDQRIYEDMLSRRYSPLASQTRRGEWRRDQPGLLERDIIKGITSEEQPEYEDQMFDELIAQNPELPEQEARRIARDYSSQLVQGVKPETRQDPLFDLSALQGGAGGGNGMNVYQPFSGRLEQDEDFNRIEAEANANIQNLSNVQEYTEQIDNISNVLSKYDIAPSLEESSNEINDLEMSPETMNSMARVSSENQNYSIDDLANKWKYDISNAFSKAGQHVGNLASNLNPKESNKRLDKISNLVDDVIEDPQQNPEKTAEVLSISGEDHEMVKRNPTTGRLEYSNKGLDLLQGSRDASAKVKLTNELQQGVRRYSDKMKEAQEEINSYIEKNPIVTEAMEELQNINPDQDPVTIAQTAIEASSNYKKQKAATHFSEFDIGDKNIIDNARRNIMSVEGKVETEDGTDLKDELSGEDVDIINMRYVPGKNSFKITTNQGDNYILDASSSSIMPTQAVDTQKKVADFLGKIRNLDFENAEPLVTVSGVPYTAVKAYDPESNSFHTGIINAVNGEPIDEGEFINRYINTMARQLGHQRSHKEEKVEYTR